MFSISKMIRATLIGAVALTAVSGAALAESKLSPTPNPFGQSAQEQETILDVLFTNDYGVPIVDLYVTNINEEYWGESLLHETLNPGEQITVDVYDFSEMCEYDIRAEFANGEVAEDWAVDFCYYTEYNYYAI